MAATKTKKKKANKSAVIREYQEANPHAGPTEVVQELGKKGIKVTVALVSNVKANAAKKSGKKKSKKKTAVSGNGQMISMTALFGAKKFAAELGGIAQAQEALAALSRLQ